MYTVQSCTCQALDVLDVILDAICTALLTFDDDIHSSIGGREPGCNDLAKFAPAHTHGF